MIVVDASIFIHILLEPGKSRQAEEILSQHDDWIAPELVDLEVLNGIRKPLLRGELGERRAQQAVEQYERFAIVRISTALLINDVWELRHNLTTYDASYIVIAKSLSISLLTRDGPMFAASKQLVDCRLI